MPETRFEQLKKYSFYIALVLLILLPVLFISPLGPGVVKWYVYKHNPADTPVQPWATEWMYTLGRYYSLTMDDKAASKTYQELFKWYRKKKKRKIATDDKWVGLSLFYEAKMMFETGHGQQAAKRFRAFLTFFGKNPKIPKELKEVARIRCRGWEKY